ncbi:MAG TPA: hypothetical protein VER12_11980 [Polyangiaceae bacterium]|nr:hypothetical protein [Polyangiaceae bacterium]
MLPPDCLHCLTIDLSCAPAPVRAIFAQWSGALGVAGTSDELRDLLCEAGHLGLPLLLLASTNTLTLVSTRQSHIRAFRPVLAVVRESLLGVAGWRTLPVRVATGSDAGRELLRQGLPEGRALPQMPDFARNLRAAAELSSACGALSSELAALVRMAEQTANRVRQETRLAFPGSSAAEIELETMDADRIVEEELVAWQSSSPALRSTRRPVSEADIGPFAGEERHSMVRIRHVSVLTKLRSA